MLRAKLLFFVIASVTALYGNSIEYKVQILADSLYMEHKGWNERIEESVGFLNKSFMKAGIEFIATTPLHHELITKTSNRHEVVFDEFSEYLLKVDFVCMFTGGQLNGFLGLGLDKANTVLIANRNEKTEPLTVAHEFGHLFGLSHVSNSDRSNLMSQKRKSSLESGFIDENIEIIKLYRTFIDANEADNKNMHNFLGLQKQIGAKYNIGAGFYADIAQAYSEISAFDSTVTYYLKDLDFLRSSYDADDPYERLWYLECYTGLGNAQIENGDYKGAVLSFRELSKLAPQRIYPKMRLVYLFEELGADSLAFYEYVEMYHIDSSNGESGKVFFNFLDSRLNLGMIERLEGGHPEIWLDYSKSRQIEIFMLKNTNEKYKKPSLLIGILLGAGSVAMHEGEYKAEVFLTVSLTSSILTWLLASKYLPSS